MIRPKHNKEINTEVPSNVPRFIMLSSFIYYYIYIYYTTIILGDFNIPDPPTTRSLNNLLTSVNLIQHVTSPTHVQGNILDLIISPKTNKIITNLTIGPPFSDHFIILLNLSHPKPTRPLTTRTSRKIHNLPIPAFIADLSSLPTTTSAELHLSLSTTLDKYTNTRPKPWLPY